MTGGSNKSQKQVVNKQAKSNKGPMTEEEQEFKRKQAEEKKKLAAAAAGLKGKKK